MKATFKTLITLLLLTVSTAGHAQKSKEGTNDSTVVPTTLTEYEFNMKIANIQENPNEFKYLGERPCVIDFYADWCRPCRILSPILNELAQEYAGKVDFYKINVDNERSLATAFSIRSIPTLLFIPMSGKPTLMQGASPKAELKKIIDELLLKKTKE